jgi:hypothetical protein
MSFEAVWGFDPDRVIQAVRLPPSEIETEKFTYSARGAASCAHTV